MSVTLREVQFLNTQYKKTNTTTMEMAVGFTLGLFCTVVKTLKVALDPVTLGVHLI